MKTWEDGTPKSTSNAFDLSEKRNSIFCEGKAALTTLTSAAASSRMQAKKAPTHIYGLSRKSEELTHAHHARKKHAKAKAT